MDSTLTQRSNTRKLNQRRLGERSYKKLGQLATVILLSVASVAALAFVGVLIDYDHYREAPSILRFALFVLLPGLALSMSMLAFKSAPLVKIRVALATLVTVAGLYTTEAIFALADMQRSQVKASTHSKFEEVLAQRENGRDAYPSIHPRDFLEQQADETYRCKLSHEGSPLLPLGGISHATTVTCNECGEYLIYGSDEHGMHNPPGLWSSESLAVVAVGDSFTQGWCVMPDEGYVALIREEFPATLNLGMAGNGPLIMLASLLEFAPQFKPKQVLWFHCENNDFHELEREKTCDLLMRYLNEERFTQGLREKQAFIDRQAKSIIEDRIAQRLISSEPKVPRSLSFVKLVRTRRRMGIAYDYGPIQGDYELFRRILEKANRTVKSWGGELQLVYLPWSHRYSEWVWTARDAEPRNEVLRITKELDIPLIDIHSKFERHPEPLSLFVGHYTAEGNRIVAETVLKSLK